MSDEKLERGSTLPIVHVDAFAPRPFFGNPAAIVMCESGFPADATCQAVAAELNLSETAFVTPRSAAGMQGSEFNLRWFSPTTEVDLCGHATLATAAALFSKGNESVTLLFHTLSGVLRATRDVAGMVYIDLPSNPSVPFPRDEVLDAIVACLGDLVPRVESLHYSPRTRKLLVRLSGDWTTKELQSAAVDPARMMYVDQSGREDQIRGVIVTGKAADGEGYDFLSRYFAPWLGIPEDPVTGSAHTVLTPYWAEQLGKNQLAARQCSLRGGDLRIQLYADEPSAPSGEDGTVDVTLGGALGLGNFVRLGGPASIVMRGELLLP